MIVLPELDVRQLASPMGRASPLTKLAVGLAWLAGLVATTDPRPTVVLLVAGVAAATGLGRVPVGRFARAWLPFVVAAGGVVLVNTVFGAANADAAARVILEGGPLRVTEPALATGLVLGLRILAIAGVGVAFAQTTEATALADALVQQARLPDRFAYGALAAYQAVPRLSLDLVTLREARRTRGLGRGWSAGLLLALLVLALRHAERLALAMDARGFDAGIPRSRFRPVRRRREDALIAALGAAALAVAILAAR
ncbi:MAG: energy-coupling factor transporter transmembrane component T [Chloroflexi bacterium]|nr:energy-coupling factor transporter transmembrane component T [Chloroflexota bacterium]